jgi:hypothetical protein
MSEQQIKQTIIKAIEQESLGDEISKVSLFGSHLKGEARPESDIDLLIEFKPTAAIGFFKFIEIKEIFEKYLQKRVDLLTPESISKYFRDELIKQAEPFYER